MNGRRAGGATRSADRPWAAVRGAGAVAVAALVTLAAVPAHAGDALAGAEHYRKLCAGCHGAGGKPVLPTAPDFTRPTALLKSDLALLAVMRDGRGAMPAFRGTLRDRELLDIVAHLRTLR